VIKFFLHISKQEQKKRLFERKSTRMILQREKNGISIRKPTQMQLLGAVHLGHLGILSLRTKNRSVIG
jgi:hypothetical protein